jgi:hypothetical protein
MAYCETVAVIKSGIYVVGKVAQLWAPETERAQAVAGGRVNTVDSRRRGESLRGSGIARVSQFVRERGHEEIVARQGRSQADSLSRHKASTAWSPAPTAY